MPTKSASDEVAAATKLRKAAAAERAGGERKSPYRGWVLLGLGLLAIGFWIGVGYLAWYLFHLAP